MQKNMWTFEKENESTKKNKTNKMYLRLLIRRYLQKVVRFLRLVLILGCSIQVILNSNYLIKKLAKSLLIFINMYVFAGSIHI